MTRPRLRCFLAAPALMILWGLLWSAPAEAESTPWTQNFHSRVRLVAGGPGPDGRPMAAIEIALDPGYKTYWRTPGAAGVPPSADFSRSANVATAEMLFPAPQAFEDGVGSSWGYHDGVVLPVVVTPASPASPVTLAIDLTYAVCEKICIPADAALRLPLSSAASAEDAAAVSAALTRVPARQKVGAPGPLAILGADRSGEGRWTVRVRAPAGETPALFAEGPAGWYFDTGAAEPGAAGLPLTAAERPRSASDGAPVRLTVVTPTRAIESELLLDGAAAKP